MIKGFFTQGAVILAAAPMAAETVDAALKAFDVRKRAPAEGEKNWMGGYPSWTIVMREKVNGLVIVDVVDAQWPDRMGDPQSEPMLFGAWSMGFMCPGTWPGGLERAIQTSEPVGREATAEAAKAHGAFVRVRSSYVLGADDQSKVAPDDYAPREELEFVTSVARAIAEAEGAICYFNPAGETLFSAAEMDEMQDSCSSANLPPLPLWSSLRVSPYPDAPGWAVADVLGMGQLDAQDHEACFAQGKYDVNEVVDFLRNVSMYTLTEGPVIKDGNTADGPGGRWQAFEVEETLLPAPRAALRWFPQSGPKPPAPLRPKGAEEPSIQPTKGGFFSRMKSRFGGG